MNYFPIITFVALLTSYMLANGVYTVILSTYTFFLYNLRVRYEVLNQNLKYVINVNQAPSIKYVTLNPVNKQTNLPIRTYLLTNLLALIALIQLWKPLQLPGSPVKVCPCAHVFINNVASYGSNWRCGID